MSEKLNINDLHNITNTNVLNTKNNHNFGLVSEFLVFWSVNFYFRRLFTFYIFIFAVYI